MRKPDEDQWTPEDWATVAVSAFGAVMLMSALVWVLSLRVVETHIRLQRQGFNHVATTVSRVEATTSDVHESVAELARETSRAQMLAIKVGVATAVLGAILGGFAGAFAARIIG